MASGPNGYTAELLSTSPLVRKVWGSIPRSVKPDAASSTARRRCDVSSEMYSQDAI